MKLDLKYPCLADDNEREEGALFFVEKFKENSNQSLIFCVGPFKDISLSDQIDNYVNFKLPVASSNIEEKGLFSKKRLMSFTLKPQTINHGNMLNIADAMFDLILAFDVAVNVDISK